jgi:hypothetical protein
MRERAGGVARRSEGVLGSEPEGRAGIADLHGLAHAPPVDEAPVLFGIVPGDEQPGARPHHGHVLVGR